ncbi:MAG: hypothetical protein EAY65_07105 [Alphaproteobacteria bacterium]|nr:MAG: hypothetical protein EAY65_07105 [Alphaproteobacteria bacterium]
MIKNSILLSALLMLQASCAPVQTTGQCDFSQLSGEISKNAPALVSDVADATAPEALNAVSFSDANIMYKIMPRSVRTNRTETGTANVEANLVNCTDYPLSVQARTQFYNKNNVRTEDVSGWTTLFLGAHSSETYQMQSISGDEAVRFSIELRENR